MPQEPQEPQEQAEAGSTTIELVIGDDGSMTVGLEGEEGAEGGKTPARNINEALSIIKQIADSLTNQMGAPAKQEEQKAFEQEMAA